MKIGILGAGFIGQAVAALAKQHGDEAMLSNSRGPETLVQLAEQFGCRAGTAVEAVEFGEVVVLAVPFGVLIAPPHGHLAGLPVAAFEGKIVIDTCNYYPERDGQIETLDRHTTTTSEMMAVYLRGARLVKALNAILARDLITDGVAQDTPNRRALPIAGDDAEAKRVVANIVDRYGFDPFDAGALADSWRFERAKPAYCIRADLAALQEKLAAARRDVELPHGSWRH